MTLPEYLPNNAFNSQWVRLADMHPDWFGKVFDELERATHASGWNPKLIRLDGDLHMVDVCGYNLSGKYYFDKNNYHIDLPHSVNVIEYIDHSFLKSAPDHCPRRVKSIYLKEVRLKHLRATDYLVVSREIEGANLAWETFRNNKNG